MSEGTGLIRRFYEDVIAGGQLELIDELTTDGMVDHEQGLPGQPEGREGVKFFVGVMREAFPDISVKSVSPAMADGDLEAGRAVLTGTHQGDLMGVPATGNQVEIETVDIIRIQDGKVAEHWGLTDAMGIMEQIGAAPG